MSKKRNKKKRSSNVNNRKPDQPAPETPATEPAQATGASKAPDGTVSRSSTSISESRFTRYFSFALLLGIIVLVGVLFYEVMASFMVPLFLSAILVVVFRPLHHWFLSKCNYRESLAAFLTTASVLLMVLVPIGVLLLLAAAESQQVIQKFSTTQVSDSVELIRSKLGMEMPLHVQDVEQELPRLGRSDDINEATRDLHRAAIFETKTFATAMAEKLSLKWNSEPWVPEKKESDPDAAPEQDTVINKLTLWETFNQKFRQLEQMHAALDWNGEKNNTPESQKQLELLHDYHKLVDQTSASYGQFKTDLLGGKTQSWLKTLANPSPEQYEKQVGSAVTYIRNTLLSLGGKGAAMAGKVFVGSFIMIIGLYFFLLDGPKMIESFKGLSPIDDQHETELVSEFSRVSRAVVVATLLSALAQGVLAGIGFYFCGLESIFLLTVLSAVLAMVPFVGAAAVWVPCAFYLYFVENQLWVALGLAVYGVAVVSMADNIIKPLILHGQSNIHPLFALLSVLGGVTALGPIGILVGPMVVAFLQTLLKILQREMMDLSQLDG